ncbi:hypothetical protein DC366_08600 [Pelagivirga sediminicola]|uniref:Hedgehog/Intein (Hint) domain-containing protein n=1 Tax=Pelagivirga sediminicola TaxID=2170575 RepID=A0A2T7G7A3_9RHOB|nr:Hint domain-containing protein [Pelagivirga sediminicola]PVA10294.1 hypothetical protein DC366_08600 [Pelagivirga sediminicola]
MVHTPSGPYPPRARPGDAQRVQTRAAAPGPIRTVTTLVQHSDGSVIESRHAVPASPFFDGAFCAFARGTLITTTRGPVAIEDLRPGMRIVTNERGPSPLLWIGAMSLRPGEAIGAPMRLTRIMTGAFGLGRPMADLMTGPGARMAQRAAGQPNQMLRPVQDMIDGNHVIAITPRSTVQLYHLGLQRHATITAAGLTLETYHPGPGFEAALTPAQLAAFIALFPHIRRPADFGSLSHPRARPSGGTRCVA